MQQPDYVPLGQQLDRRQVWLLLASLMLALFLAALDQTIVSTATPRILASLGGFNLFSWLFTSYLLSSTVVVPLVGKLSDIYGRRNFLLGGIMLFLAASALCGLAPNMTSLIIFRGIQGIGGGVLFATVFATTGDLFPPAERGRYIGLFTGVFSLASILGPALGGVITDNLGWRWVFYVNIPVGAVALPAIWFNLPARPAVARPRIDVFGAAALTVTSVVLLLALNFAGDRYSWGSPQIIAMFVATAVFAGIFIWIELRHPEPVLPLHLFRNGAFLWANLIGFAVGMSMFGALTYLPTFVQTSLDASATASGIITTPQSVGSLVASIIGGQVLTRTGRYRWQTFVGTVAVLLVMLFLSNVGVGTPRWHISAVMILLGVGIGLILPTVSLASQNAVGYQYLGVATSTSQFFRQIGGVLGVAIFGVILANSYDSAFESNLPQAVSDGLPAGVVAEFNNPTVMLDEERFALLEAEVVALPGGAALLADAVDTIRESVAVASRHLYTASAVMAAIAILMTLVMREIPLRRDFGPASPPGRHPPEGSQGPELPPLVEGVPATSPGPAGGGGSA